MADIFERACARVDNLQQALGWVIPQLKGDKGYQKSFQRFTEGLTRRRHTQSETESARQQPGQVHFCAIGKSGDVSKLLVSMLTSVGVRASFLHPTEALHGDLGSVAAQDLVVFISNKGESSELLQLIPLLRHRKAECFAMTSRIESALARAVDEVLCLPSVEEMCAHNHAPVASTVVALAVGQLLVAASMDNGELDLETYAHNHPGGAIGRRIFVKVSDLMITGEELPVVAREANFEETVAVVTEKACGVTFVLLERKLCGIITEKDLRNAMKTFGPEIFGKTAGNLMNPQPITIAADTLAVEALRLMESRNKPLNVLPVLNSCGEALGLLRLHDLVKAGISL